MIQNNIINELIGKGVEVYYERKLPMFTCPECGKENICLYSEGMFLEDIPYCIDCYEDKVLG